MTCSLRGLCLGLAFVALLNASCYRSVPLTSTARPLHLAPTPLTHTFAAAGNVHLRGTLYFADGTFRFADTSGLRVRIAKGTAAEYDIVLDMSGSRANAAVVSLKPEVKRVAFRWNRDIEVTNDRRLSDDSLPGPRAWLTIRTIHVENAMPRGAAWQGVDIALGRSLALLVAHVIADESGEILTEAKKLIRSVYLRESEIGMQDEATPGGEGQSADVAAGSQGWLRYLSYAPWRPPVIAAPDDAAAWPAAIAAAPAELGTAPAFPPGFATPPPPAGVPPHDGFPLTASAAVADPRIQLRKDAQSSPEFLAGRSTKIAGIVAMSLGGGTVFGGLVALIWGSLRGAGWNNGGLGPDRGAQAGGGVMMALGAGAMGAGGAAIRVGKEQMKKVEEPYLPVAMPATIEVHLGAGSLGVSGSF